MINLPWRPVDRPSRSAVLSVQADDRPHGGDGSRAKLDILSLPWGVCEAITRDDYEL
jgi:hypothetical protein